LVIDNSPTCANVFFKYNSEMSNLRPSSSRLSNAILSLLKTWRKILLLIILLTISSYFVIRSFPTFKKTASVLSVTTETISITPTTAPVPTTNTGSCQIKGALPDPSCTPGAIDPKVTQDNIDQTICVKGYTQTVRPPVLYTNKLKKQQIEAYGYIDKDLRDYEEDHLISLEIGGNPTDPKNLWPEPGASPNPKDEIENLCHTKICSGQITLAQAQHEIATDWQTACQ
jgi:hypothetical protein